MTSYYQKITAHCKLKGCSGIKKPEHSWAMKGELFTLTIRSGAAPLACIARLSGLMRPRALAHVAAASNGKVLLCGRAAFLLEAMPAHIGTTLQFYKNDA